MGSLPRITPAQVLHPVPRPIAAREFSEAVRAVTPPRFPRARSPGVPRRIGLAVSGGVDSMALAFMFNRLREMEPMLRIVDNPLTKMSAFVIDHGLRPESADEADAVVRELRNFKHVAPSLHRVNWKKEGYDLGDDEDGKHPSTAPNLESIARRVRYRRLGVICRTMHVESIFLAHHADDQHETVLMRLLAGHGSRGLRGMAPRGVIPECFDLHGVHESGHVDDQASAMPKVSFRLPRRDWKYIRRELQLDLDWELYKAELRAGLPTGAWRDGLYHIDDDALFAATASASAKARARRDAAAAAAASRNLARIETEDAGVMIYRPLLGFGKDRLVATCEANNVRWFEDATNADQTLTLRNAVRHMVREHALPEALQRDSVLRLAARCDARVAAQEGEAERWILRSGAAVSFEPNAGTLVVALPSMAVPPPTRPRSAFARKRRELRLAHRRLIAALVIRRLIGFVSPEKQHAQIASLLTIVGRLFPDLDEPGATNNLPRKPFNLASVLFLPLDGAPNRWYLVREPYPSLQPLPKATYTTARAVLKFHPQFPPQPRPKRDENGHLVLDDDENTTDGGGTDRINISNMERLQQLHRQPLPLPSPQSIDWHTWRRFQIWDGRFWIRVRSRVNAVFRVAPFSQQHAKAFREGLAQSDPAAAAAESVGENPEDVLARNLRPSLYAANKAKLDSAREAAEDPRVRLESVLKRFAPGKVRYTLPALYAVNVDEDTGAEVLRMLALPTLGVQLPGLERWVRYEVRYRKVDWDLLDHGGEDRTRGGEKRRRKVQRKVTTAATARKNKRREVGERERKIPLYN
ncbi:PP-loop family protein [Colletotrichum musicola]|uniref:tRNA(Ile)-lysidine synthetase n=1 Tax=Colletotrichum musicola TaxID=2175873 RepID=A0A8H6JX30_9PEZI|nr:PP-loop family protein [Colletotrichum musicola]